MPEPTTPQKIVILPCDIEKMRLDVTRRLPEEACGLLGGNYKGGSAYSMAVIPTTNEVHSPVKYRAEPKEQYEAFVWFETRGMELIGIYHSHPTGPSIPSSTDIIEAYYPGVVHLIWSRPDGDWICRAFLIQERLASEVEILTPAPE